MHRDPAIHQSYEAAGRQTSATSCGGRRRGQQSLPPPQSAPVRHVGTCRRRSAAMEEVMRLKSITPHETIQNGNTHSLGSLTDGNRNGPEKTLKQEDTGKWIPAWPADSKNPENFNNDKQDSQPVTPIEEEEPDTTSSSSSCSASDSEEEVKTVRRGFSNPNYPGFSHLAHELRGDFDNNNNSSNNNEELEENLKVTPDSKDVDWVNRVEGCQVKEIYRRSKLDLGEVKESNMAVRASGKREKTEINNSLKRGKGKDTGDFDVYNIETALPKIDLEAIESHLRAAREEERRRRNDREEIRRRLAAGCDSEDYYGNEKPGKKPSLQARLQSGMNLQICFMNETSSDTESPSAENAPPTTSQTSVAPEKTNKTPPEPPKSLNLPNISRTRNINSTPHSGPQSLKGFNNFSQSDGGDFFSRQARLQTEARLALAQAKERARMQMEAERCRSQASPITQMLRESLNKVGIKFPEDRRRLSRQMLTDMNVAQLQVIVNDLHTQIEILNESLVKFLMERDELHMSQDSMLVDIEDITRYLGAKESCLKEDIVKNNNIAPQQVHPPQQSRPVITRIVSLGKK